MRFKPVSSSTSRRKVAIAFSPGSIFPCVRNADFQKFQLLLITIRQVLKSETDGRPVNFSMSVGVAARMQMPAAKIIKAGYSLVSSDQNETLPSVSAIHADFHKRLAVQDNTNLEIKW